MRKIEKHLKEELKENKGAIDAIMDSYVSSLGVYKASAEKQISEANLNIQKIMTNTAVADADDIINEMFKNLCAIDEANDQLDKLAQIESMLFEDIPERTVVKGLKKN